MIEIAPISASQPGQAAPGAQSSGQGEFAALLDLAAATAGPPPAAIHGPAPKSPAPEAETLVAPLLERIEELLGLLGESAAQTAEALAALDPDILSELTELAAALQAALADPGAPEGEAAAPRDPAPPVPDRLAALAARLGAALREAEPEVAERLASLARAIDAHAARLEAERPPELTPAMRRLLAEAEARPHILAALDGVEKHRPVLRPDAPVPDRLAVRPEPAPQTPQGAPATAGPTPPPATPLAAGAESPPVPEASIAAQAPAASAAAAAPRPGIAAYQRPDPQINLPHVAVEIARHLRDGINRFEIRLNPAELGRIEVRMELDASGGATARLAVERVETLDLLQRDQRALERALAQAGLDAGRTSLEFSLKREGGQRPGFSAPDVGTGGDADPSLAEPAAEPARRAYVRADAVNLWV